jgi:hypothetical protein
MGQGTPTRRGVGQGPDAPDALRFFLPMDLDGNSILASLLIGLIGAGCFMYGRRQGRVPPMAVGAALVVYPYFVTNVAAMIGIAVALLAALWGAVRLGL